MEKEQEERLKHVAAAAVGLASVYAASRIVHSYRRNGEQGQVYITPYDNFFVEKLDGAGKVFLRLSGKILGLNRENGTFEGLEHAEVMQDIPDEEIAGFEKLYVKPPQEGDTPLQNG
jgi:hypothetical protein